MYCMCEDVVVTLQKTQIFSSTKSSPVISYREVIDVYRNNRVDHKHTTCGQNTYLLTPWSRVLLEKLTGSAASQEIPRIFGTRRFLTVLTSARHLSLS